MNKKPSLKRIQKYLDWGSSGSQPFAREVLLDVLHMMSKGKINVSFAPYIKLSIYGYCGYLRTLSTVNQALNQEDYCGACYELLKVFCRNKSGVMQLRLWYNIIVMLNHMEGCPMLRLSENDLTLRERLRIRRKVSKTMLPGMIKMRNDSVMRRDFLDEYYMAFDHHTFQIEYNKAMNHINRMLGVAEKEGTNPVDFLDFAIDMVKNDIKYDFLSQIIYSDIQAHLRIHFPFPQWCYGENREKIHFLNMDKGTSVDLTRKCVISVPWKEKSMIQTLANIRKFQYDDSNHEGVYYPQLDLCFITGGNHSIAVGIHRGQGSIQAFQCDMVPLFEHISTNGMAWYCRGRELEKVGDFRFAVLFELAKMKHEIKLK